MPQEARADDGRATLAVRRARCAPPGAIRSAPTDQWHRRRTAPAGGDTAARPAATPRPDRTADVAARRPDRDPERPVYVISVAASIVSVASADAADLRGRGPHLPGANADQHPPLLRGRHPAGPVDPPPDPGPRRQPRRRPDPVRARGAPRHAHPGGPVRRRDAGSAAEPTARDRRRREPRRAEARP